MRNAAIMKRFRRMASLNQFLAIRNHLIAAKRFYLNRIWGMDIHPTVGFSLSVRFDKTNPRGISHRGEFLSGLRQRGFVS